MEAAQAQRLLAAQIKAIESAFAERDKHLAALRNEVKQLEEVGKDTSPSDTKARLARIEARLDEQEHSLRHVLTMMIEFFENSSKPAAI